MPNSMRSQAASVSVCQRGVLPGERVAFFLGNCVEFVASFFACTRYGFIVVPIGVRQNRPELEFLLDYSGAKVILFESALSGVVSEAGPDPVRISVHGPADAAEPIEALLHAGRAAACDVVIREEDTAVILSGTTGKPKGAKLTHLGMIHSALPCSRCYVWTRTIVVSLRSRCHMSRALSP
jgi:long-chain acyl-CoA synthetase